MIQGDIHINLKKTNIFSSKKGSKTEKKRCRSLNVHTIFSCMAHPVCTLHTAQNFLYSHFIYVTLTFSFNQKYLSLFQHAISMWFCLFPFLTWMLVHTLVSHVHLCECLHSNALFLLRLFIVNRIQTKQPHNQTIHDVIVFEAGVFCINFRFQLNSTNNKMKMLAFTRHQIYNINNHNFRYLAWNISNQDYK